MEQRLENDLEKSLYTKQTHVYTGSELKDRF